MHGFSPITARLQRQWDPNQNQYVPLPVVVEAFCYLLMHIIMLGSNQQKIFTKLLQVFTGFVKLNMGDIDSMP